MHILTVLGSTWVALKAGMCQFTISSRKIVFTLKLNHNSPTGAQKPHPPSWSARGAGIELFFTPGARARAGIQLSPSRRISCAMRTRSPWSFTHAAARLQQYPGMVTS
jgi:hypothetical protein